MAHKKGRSGRSKASRTRNDRTYPAKLERCSSRIAKRCKGWYNPYHAKQQGICNRCWQSISAKKHEKL